MVMRPPTPGLLCACLRPPRSPGHGDGPSDVPLGSPSLAQSGAHTGPGWAHPLWGHMEAGDPSCGGRQAPRSGGHPELASGTKGPGALTLGVGREEPELGGGGYGWGPTAKSCPVRGPPAPGQAKGRAAGRPWAGLSPPPALELRAQPGPHLPWGRLVSPDGPSRQNRPSPDPSARRRPPTNSLGGLVLDRVSPETSPQCGHLPRGRQRDAGPTRQWAPGLPGGHCGFPAPAVPRGHLVCEAAGVRCRVAPMRHVGGWCHCCELCAHKCACVCTREPLRARRGDPCAAVCEPLALCLSWSRWWL